MAKGKGAGQKKNKQTEAAKRARNIEREAERLARKEGKKKRTAKEIAVIVVSVIFVISILLPSFSQIFAQPNSSNNSFPTSFDDAQERYKPDVDKYREEVKANPDDKEAQYKLGEALYQWGIYAQTYASDDGQSDEAVQLLDEAQTAYTSYLDLEGSLDSTQAKSAATYRALATYYTGDAEKAEQLLEDLGNEVNYAPAWANLGMMYQQEGDTTKALAAYQKGVEADPDGSQQIKEYCEQQISSLKAQSAQDTGGAAGLAQKLDGTSTDQGTDQTQEATQ